MGGYNGKDPKIVQSGVETVPRLTFHPQIILLKKTAPIATRTAFFNEIAATESEVPGPLSTGSASPGNELSFSLSKPSQTIIDSLCPPIILVGWSSRNFAHKAIKEWKK